MMLVGRHLRKRSAEAGANLSAGMALHICSREPHCSLALEESTLNSMCVKYIERWSTYADMSQIKAIFLITIGTFELG